MLALKLAYRNLIGGKLRTVLNVLVLSFAYVIIIWQNERTKTFKIVRNFPPIRLR